MSNNLLKKMRKMVSCVLKMAIMVLFILSQSFLWEIYSYHYNRASINTARADAADPWYNIAYSYRKSLVIDYTKVPNTDQANFPMLVSVTDNSLKTTGNGGRVRNANGYDIVFTNKDGDSQLDHEIESYDAVTGTVIMWVRIPVLSHTVNTIIYMYYGNSDINTSQEDKTGVWDNNYSGVYHLKESGMDTAGDFKDSTANGKSSVNTSNQPSRDTGKISYGQVFNGSSQYVGMGNNLNIGATNFTLSAWIKPANANQFSPIISKRNVSPFEQYNLELGYTDSDGSGVSTKGVGIFVYNGVDWTSSHIQSYYTPDFVDGNWHYVATTRTGGIVAVYVDGIIQTLMAVFDNTTSLNSSSSANFNLGNDNGSSYYNGSMDEARISTSYARSSDWIATEYNNQNNPSAFYTLSAEEDALPAILVEAASIVTPTSDSTPSYTFTSTKVGAIAYGGDCRSATASAVAGSNTVTFNSLSDGAHSNCTIKVTNAQGIDSNVLSLSSFTVDTVAPTSPALSSPANGTHAYSKTPAFVWGSAVDSGSGLNKYQLYIDGVMDKDNVDTVSSIPSSSLSCGEHTWYVRAIDNVNNAANSSSYSFTVLCGGGTGNISLSAKPNTASIISFLGTGIGTDNIPSNITQIAISRTADFNGVSWQVFDKNKFSAINQEQSILYLKFRTKEGAVSDIVTYTPSATLSLNEGDIVKTADNPDVYIIKYSNHKQYKRLILSPLVFNSYRHLKWENIRLVSQSQIDAYLTSNLVQVQGDNSVYELIPSGDKGERRIWDIGKPYDGDSVYEINSTDRDSYKAAR